MKAEVRNFNVDLQGNRLIITFTLPSSGSITVALPLDASGDLKESQLRLAGNKAAKVALQAAIDAL